MTGPKRFARACTALAVSCVAVPCALAALGGALLPACRRNTASPGPSGGAPTRPRAHMDHDPRHGGMLLMSGDQHVEIVVEPTGDVRVFVSDAFRAEMNPTEVTGVAVRRGPDGTTSRIELHADAASGAVVGRGAPPEGPFTTYDLDLHWRTTPVRSSVQIMAGGTAATIAAAGGTSAHDHAGHDHGAHEHTGTHEHTAVHGGSVVSAGDGHVEVRMDASGRLTLWSLDANGTARTARGAQASVRLALPGAVDTPLAYDATADALVVQMTAPAGRDSIVALVRFTPPSAASAIDVRVPLTIAASPDAAR